MIAAPVAPPTTVSRLKREVDDVVCDETPKNFVGVGQFYRDFTQVSDEKVNELLKRAAEQRATVQTAFAGF